MWLYSINYINIVIIIILHKNYIIVSMIQIEIMNYNGDSSNSVYRHAIPWHNYILVLSNTVTLYLFYYTIA